jgi:hypothetical protein
MPTSELMLGQVRKHWDELKEGDNAAAHSVYHPDVVLEFPQSGERFEGLANFQEWRSKYPAKVDYRIRRMVADGNLARRRVLRQL